MSKNFADMPEIVEVIAENDEMFSGDTSRYFGVGQSALANIIQAMEVANKSNCQSILDMPCGYGRVLRFLRAKFPAAEITACDLNPGAVDFCVSTFGVKGTYSQKYPDNLRLRDKFDLIWCGSLLTHLDLPLWKVFIDFFSDHLRESGILTFTTHGRLSVKWIFDHQYDYGLDRKDIPNILNCYKSTGFGYLNYPHVAGYGISIASPAKVLAELQCHADLKILSFVEAGWDNHQDVISCIRKSGYMPKKLL